MQESLSWPSKKNLVLFCVGFEHTSQFFVQQRSATGATFGAPKCALATLQWREMSSYWGNKFMSDSGLWNISHTHKQTNAFISKNV